MCNVKLDVVPLKTGGKLNYLNVIHNASENIREKLDIM